MEIRQSFAYVVSVDGPRVTLNLKETHRGHVSAHFEGVVNVTDIGSIFAVEHGHRILVLRVRSLTFAEPKEAHQACVDTTSSNGEPLRNLIAHVAGYLERDGAELTFVPDSLTAPPLGAHAYPLTRAETAAVFRLGSPDGSGLLLGETVRGFGSLKVDTTRLLRQHVAVLGGTGYGKSCFTAAMLQQLAKKPKSRIVIFDVNGEYADALRSHVPPGKFRETVLGGPSPDLRLPYYALGRQGLFRLLLPSDKTQRPALVFALQNLPFVEWRGDGASLVGEAASTLFDDCRPDGAQAALAAITRLRAGTATPSLKWPPMNALSCLIAESYCVQQGKYNPERNAFNYGNVAPLVSRINRLLEDPMFTSVVDVDGTADLDEPLNVKDESRKLVAEIFGDEKTPWCVHVINLRNVTHDQMPMILGSLLELYAYSLFERGQDNAYPTLLVLEEAHHYLRQIADGEDGSKSALAYERLAKEGRKFGLSLWISTQRPSEVSATVLAQCGTWIAFRLTGESDLRALGNASEWVDKSELAAISGLPRQQAIVMGASVTMPVRVVAPTASPLPLSHDPDFSVWE